ncbi:hypothetical protein Bbelb_282710 [Branchiostoma belcheri]|nr:hypothetical protein Bbelb_282710 [Branchiostoma belcheri]
MPKPIPAAVLPFSNELSQMKKHKCTCKRCKVHGVSVKLTGQKKDCPRQHCKCPGCSLVVAYREEHARDQFQLRQSESSDGEPTTLSAAEVIQITNVSRGTTATGPTSISGKLRQKQVARGVRNKDLYEKLNKSMEEYARESPGIHLMLHMRKAISQIESSQFIISYVNSTHNAIVLTETGFPDTVSHHKHRRESASYIYYICQNDGSDKAHRARGQPPRKTDRKNKKARVQTGTTCSARMLLKSNLQTDSGIPQPFQAPEPVNGLPSPALRLLSGL